MDSVGGVLIGVAGRKVVVASLVVGIFACGALWLDCQVCDGAEVWHGSGVDLWVRDASRAYAVKVAFATSTTILAILLLLFLS